MRLSAVTRNPARTKILSPSIGAIPKKLMAGESTSNLAGIDTDIFDPLPKSKCCEKYVKCFTFMRAAGAAW